MRLALILSGSVANVVDAEDGWHPPAPYIGVQVPDGLPVGIGWGYNAKTAQFLEPGPALDSQQQQTVSGVESVRLTLLRAHLWDRIKAERDRRSQLGGFPVGQHWFHSDTFSRTQQLGLLLMGQNMPGGLMWKTMSSGFVLMTPSLIAQIFNAAGTQDSKTFAHAETLRAAVNAATDPNTVDISAGWPPIYGE